MRPIAGTSHEACFVVRLGESDEPRRGGPWEGRIRVAEDFGYVIGAWGKIEFCVFPSCDYAMIIRTEAGWQFETNPKTVSRAWSKQTFFEVESELARKA